MAEGETQIKSAKIWADSPYIIVPQELLIRILERLNIPIILRHILRGEVLVDVQNNIWEPGKPLLNEEGIKSIIAIVNNYVSQDKIATNITDEEVIRMARDVRVDIIFDLSTNYRKYDVEKSKLDSIVDLVDHTVFANLTSSRKGTFLELAKPTYKRIEEYRPEEKKGGLINIPFFGGGGK